jgi:hypothetical protein
MRGVAGPPDARFDALPTVRSDALPTVRTDAHSSLRTDALSSARTDALSSAVAPPPDHAEEPRLDARPRRLHAPPAPAVAAAVAVAAPPTRVSGAWGAAPVSALRDVLARAAAPAAGAVGKFLAM